MKLPKRGLLALTLSLGLVMGLAGPATADNTGVQSFLNVNDPGVYCGFSTTETHATNPTDYSRSTVIVKANNPCVYSSTSSQTPAAGTLGMEQIVQCRESATDTVQTVYADAAWLYNGAGDPDIVATFGNLNDSGPCTSGTRQYRTITKGRYMHSIWIFVTRAGDWVNAS